MVWIRIFCGWSKIYQLSPRPLGLRKHGSSATMKSYRALAQHGIQSHYNQPEKKRKFPCKCLGTVAKTSNHGRGGCHCGGTNHYSLAFPDYKHSYSTSSHIVSSRILHYFEFFSCCWRVHTQKSIIEAISIVDSGRYYQQSLVSKFLRCRGWRNMENPQWAHP